MSWDELAKNFPAGRQSAQTVIDLRSDTVTRPTPGMRAAMAAAEVGDDVFGDDPTVNRLQSVAAERFGFEGALFFPTGTQSNLAALMAHCGRGDEFLVGQEAHTYKYEQGGAAVLGSIQPQPLEHEPHGGIALERIAAAIKSDDYHFARTRLLALENTIGGRVLPIDYLQQVTEFAHSRGLATHLDGARIFNVIVKLSLDERAAVAGFDSVSMCLSKGLGAPAGSILMGSRALIADARRWRKALNAEHLAAGLREAGLKVTPPQTNVVYIEVPASQIEELRAHLKDRGVIASVAPRTRLMTHMDLTRTSIDAAIRAFREYPHWAA